ncbi:MAG: hypothetical protein JWM59_3046 [Verrucomicrobiales bacterium]|nr:hypothetical protein [Verrucomicrobiales bacterium]
MLSDGEALTSHALGHASSVLRALAKRMPLVAYWKQNAVISGGVAWPGEAGARRRTGGALAPRGCPGGGNPAAGSGRAFSAARLLAHRVAASYSVVSGTGSPMSSLRRAAMRAQVHPDRRSTTASTSEAATDRVFTACDGHSHPRFL